MSSIKLECPACGCFNPVSSQECWKCSRPISESEKAAAIGQDEREEKIKRDAERDKQLSLIEKYQFEIDRAKESGNWSGVSEEAVAWASHKILLTTSHQLGNGKSYRELDIISVEVVFGMNAFKDMFKIIRDIVGGRSQAVEKLMKTSRQTAMAELRKEALMLGADAVVAVDLDYVEIGADSGGMVLLVATGTAVVYS